ncbi:MAG: hypothetical protein EBR07_08450 [Planctomycetes bacterium]|nr:hypothetical protein [Planctomycetota bacterium]
MNNPWPDSYPDEETRAAQFPERAIMASDPSTPIEKLIDLLTHFPLEVCGNPAWQLAVIASPSIVGTLKFDQLEALVEHESTGGGLWMSVAQRVTTSKGDPSPYLADYIQWNIASRADAAKSVLEVLIKPWDQRKMGTPAQELALHRLNHPEGSGIGWQETVPLAIAVSDYGRSKLHRQRDRFISGLLAEGHLSPSAPIVAGLVLLGRKDVSARIMRHVPPEAKLLHAMDTYRTIGRTGRVDPVDLLLRAAIRCWNSSVSRGRLPYRCDSTPFSYRRISDPIYFRPFEASFASLTEASGATPSTEQPTRSVAVQGTCTLADFWKRTRVERSCAPWVSGTAEHLALLSSDLCPAELLQTRAWSRDWMVRLSIAMNRTVDRCTLEQLRLDRHWLVRSAAEDAIVRYPVPTPKPHRAGRREMTQEDWDEITKGGVLMYFGNKPKASSTQQAPPLLATQSQQESNHPTLPQA